jgi:hypothetical protein
MQDDPAISFPPSRLHRGIVLFVGLLVVGVSASVGPAQQRQAANLPGNDAIQEAALQQLGDKPAGPNFILIPIRTELQRKLVANGKRIQALVLLNGYALLGKREELMRAIDALPLQQSLAAFRTNHPGASIALIIGYYGPASEEQFQSSDKNREAIEKTCRLVANGAKVPVIYVTSTYDGSDSGRWERMVATLRGIDLAKETADEAPAEDADVQAFPVQTQVSRLLTTGYWNGAWLSADCIVYVKRPIEAKNSPLIEADLEAHIAGAVKRLSVSNKNRIDYHLFPANPSRQAHRKNRDAIDKRFVGKESEQLTQRLGFKKSSVIF